MNTNLNIHSATFAVPFNLTDDINRNPSSLSGSDIHTKKSVPIVPLHEKFLLSVVEAAAYFGIGQNRISELALQDGCKFVVFVGNKKLIKRKSLRSFWTSNTPSNTI